MNIFLTGATGFLGGKLIHLLVEQEHHVYLLARNMEKAERLRTSLPAQFQHAVHIIKGDITEPYLGISESTFNELENKIELFYHVAALVRFDQDLREELYQANVIGTENALNAAERFGVRRFFHVSTAYTVGKNRKGKERLYTPESDFNNPYEETKVLAEHRVFARRDRMDVAIFRPSIIVGDSKTGEADSTFTLYGFLRAIELFKRRHMKRLGAEASIHLIGSDEGTSNLVPVDYVADVLAIAAQHGERDTIYNIVNTNPPTNRKLLGKVKETLRFPNLSILNKAELKFTNLSTEEKQLHKFVEVFDPYLSCDIRFEADNTMKLLQQANVEPLHMQEDMLSIIFNGYAKQNM